MRKKLIYENLDNGTRSEFLIRVEHEGDHFAARLETQGDVRTPVFYGTTQEQAERQLRKVLERDRELIEESVVVEEDRRRKDEG